MTKTYNVLFLCTGNSARSILAQGAGAVLAVTLLRLLDEGKDAR